MMFQVGDNVECVKPDGPLINGAIYHVDGVRVNGNTVFIRLRNYGAYWFYEGRFIAHGPSIGVLPPSQLPEDAAIGCGAIEPNKELTPEEKLREYRKSLRDMIGL